jgi:two-component system, OmpR family, phosphate regulon sensor histidine kinase PhoR
MTLTRRLLAGATVVIVALVTAIVTIAGGRLRGQLESEETQDLLRSANMVALTWHTGINADSLAHAAGAALQRRVTLIGSDGVVRGDSRFTIEEIRGLENHATRPEVVDARANGWGTSRRPSASEGDDEMYVAVRHPLGFARVSINLRTLNGIVWAAQRDVLMAGVLGLLGAFVLAALFARSVSKPVGELRDVARAIADGDLARRPQLDAPGEIGDLSAAVHRMTEQLSARLAALQSQEALLRATIEALDEGIVAVDARQTVVRINTSARRLLGISDEAPFSADRLPPDRVMRDALRGAMAGASPDSAELSIGDRAFSVVARPLVGGGAVLAMQDLSARRRLDSVRREFVANASHELKTPLTVVSGFAETLLDPDIGPEDRRRFAAMIRTSARRMQHIVDDLLDLSRYESGSWVPNPERVDVRAIAAETLGAVEARAHEKSLELVAQIPDDAATVNADVMALRQILANLTQNAVRFTNAGSVTLFTRRENGGVRIGLRDTGIGIAGEHLPRLFERFYRVDPARSRDEGGTGLGLAIVKHLTEAHGGTVRADSVVGAGTTVSIYLPDTAASR